MAQTGTKVKRKTKPETNAKAEENKPAASAIGGEAGDSQTVVIEIETVEMTVPLAPIVDGEYAQRHIDLQLEGVRAETLKRIADGLIVHGATLSTGRKVTSSADAIRWWLDGVAEANAEATNEAAP